MRGVTTYGATIRDEQRATSMERGQRVVDRFAATSKSDDRVDKADPERFERDVGNILARNGGTGGLRVGHDFNLPGTGLHSQCGGTQHKIIESTADQIIVRRALHLGVMPKRIWSGFRGVCQQRADDDEAVRAMLLRAIDRLDDCVPVDLTLLLGALGFSGASGKDNRINPRKRRAKVLRQVDDYGAPAEAVEVGPLRLVAQQCTKRNARTMQFFRDKPAGAAGGAN
ncbi:hypothetical protein ABIC31_006016 [Paraburkholderia caledonica]